MFLAKKIQLPELLVYNNALEAGLTSTALTLGNTQYSEGEIHGQVEFANSPLLPVSTIPNSMTTKGQVNAALDSIYSQNHTWTGKNVFATATSSLDIVDDFYSVRLNNLVYDSENNENPNTKLIALDYVYWIRGSTSSSPLIVWLPYEDTNESDSDLTVLNVNQKITIRNDSIYNVTVGANFNNNNGYIYDGIVGIQSVVVVSNTSVTLYCKVVDPPTWLRL